jgi:NAD+ synthase
MAVPSLQLADPQSTILEAVEFLRTTFTAAGKTHGLIAVSGGIDSALSATLLVQALGPEHVTAVLLPYATQSMDDARLLVQHLNIPAQNISEINIQPMVEAAAQSLKVKESVTLRRGNIQARCRMICVFDLAKKLDALVCGTENKSEHYLGYFTRFGDAASDIEPICHLYKTQVRQLVEHLQLPAVFLEKPPSAGLWVGQTDEAEMGFTYEVADQVMVQYVDEKISANEVAIENVEKTVIQKVIAQIDTMKFKLEVPYLIKEKYV